MKWTKTILSWVYYSVTNNNGFWIGYLHLLTPSFTITRNHNQLLELTIDLQPNPSSWTAEDSPHSRSRSTTDFCQSRHHVTTGGQSASLSWWQCISGAYDKIFIVRQLRGFVDVGRSLWREDVSAFTFASGPRQRSHSRVRVPRDSWPHFTVSDFRDSPNL
jgi:hypothetical protein